MASHPVEIIDQLVTHLRTMAGAGRTGFDCPEAALERIAGWGTPIGGNRKSVAATGRADLAECRRCPLCETRGAIVAGDGNPNARLMFIGEWPSAEDEARKRPFADAAGELLDRIIQAITLSREEVYITHLVKCHPPGDRRPTAEEAAACLAHLEHEIETVHPQFICTLGALPAHMLLHTDLSIDRLRGRFHDYHGIPLVATHPPALLLKDPGKKRDVWEDMKRMMREMGISTP